MWTAFYSPCNVVPPIYAAATPLTLTFQPDTARRCGQLLCRYVKFEVYRV